ncbi:DNRLRE domain-containing protein [Phycicoccus sp. Soil802]|uniref:DNRLRE domain-containing protein n=1 Tax=Phycicoccus sp. Soil802 TaxID=1736414 RepID=UPI00138ED804|nr:DNRLRE domain-containing protein [Phycicoccus sp. Soil802]
MKSSRVLSSSFRGGRLRPSLKVAAIAVTSALTLTIGVVEPAAAASTVTKAKAEKVTSRPDEVSARVTARAQGTRVEVESLRDERSTTWANPNGTMTTQAHAGQIRFKDTKGQWRDVDLTLEAAADGTVAPKGHPQGLSLAGAGKAAGGVAKGATDTDLVFAEQGKGKRKQDRDVTLGWGGGKLGTPVLSGTTATYKDVKPGIDLVVDTRRTGYETHLVIKTAAALASLQAAAKNGPVAWDIPVKTKGLSARSEKDGSVSFVDADGQVASRVAAPIAWDAAVDARSGNRVNESPVVMTVTQKGSGKAVLTLTPDQDWLTSTDRKFPITIDPSYASGTSTASFDTYVSSAYPTATYSTSTELRVGTYDGGGDKYRSFLTFPISGAGMNAKDIVSASLSLYEFHSWSCTAKPFYVYSASGGTSATNWNNQPAGGTNYGSLSVAKGFSSSCAGGRVSVPITSMIQWWTDSGSSAGGIRLSASETDSYGWKKFYSVDSTQDPYITFTYNRKPNAATAPTMEAAYTPSYKDPRDGLTYLFTSDSTPRFYSKATDPDGSTVSVTFEVHSSTAGTAASKVSSCATGYGASGTSVYCSPTTALANNTYYYARAAVQDDRHLWNGTWSAWTKFGTAYNNPPAPTVSCPGYSDGSWTDTAPSADVTCTIKATGITNDWSTPGYLDLTVDGVVKPRMTITPTNDPNVVATTVTIPKTANGSHIIIATAVARTLKTTSKTVGFGWGGASVSAPTVGTASSGKIAIKAAGPPRASSASVTGKVQWRVAGSGNETTGWTDGPTVPVTNAAGAAPSASDPVVVNSSFTLASAVREAGASADLNSRVPVLLDVQVCFTYAGVSTPQCTWSQSPRSVTRVPHAFGNGYPTADAGPGQVALFTGEFNTSATDVSVPGYSGDLALSRSHTSFDGDGTVAGWPTDPVTGVFGPGWTASLEGPDAGAAGLQVIDNTRSDGTIVLVDEEGEPLVFQTPTKDRAYKVTVTGSAKSPYLPATTDTTAAAADLTVTNSTAAAGASMLMTLKEEDGTVTSWAPVAYSATADTDWVPVSVNEPGQVGSTTYGHDTTGRVTRIVAAVPPNGATPPAAAVTCPTSGTLVKGCRGLDITYATATTATATTPGDYSGRVKFVTATLWDPATATMVPTVVATYKYDSSGRLVNVTDPRVGLGTDYTWDGTSTRLASVKSSGLAAFRLSYDYSTPATPRVAAVTRDNPAGSGSAVTLARYNYAVPLSGTGLPDLTSDSATDQVRLWNQASNPITGYAVFGADYPSTDPISGAGVDWSKADLQYADDQGYTVNAATYGAGGWQVTATDYDGKGNTVRELDAGATKSVRDAASSGTALDAGQVDALSAQTVYNADILDSTGKVVTEAGTLVTDTYGRARNAWVNADANNNGVVGDPGDVTSVRPHTRTVYDQGAPNVVNGVGTNPANGEPYRLPTTVTVGATTSGASTGQAHLETTSTTVNSYAKLVSTDATEGDPWALGSPTKVTTAGITQTTRYDTEGRATESRQPLSSGADAGTTKTLYYTAYANAADAACGNKVEWAGLACRTLPAAAPSAGAGGAATLPDSRTTAYDAWLRPLTVVETSGAVTRTTQTQYDSVGRSIKTWTDVAGLTGSTSRPGTFTHYIPAGSTAAGSVDYSGNLNAGKTDADPVARTSTTYDAWGRALTSTNDLGDSTTTTYVAPGTPGAGSVATVADAEGTTSFTYDGTDAVGNAERRGVVTSQTITRPGVGGALTFKAAYDADGSLVTQKLPGQVTQTSGYDEAGEPESLTYSGTVQPVKQSVDANGDPIEDENGPVYETNGAPLADQPWLAWSVTNDAQGRVKSEFTGPSAGFDGNPGVNDPHDITGFDVSDAAVGYNRLYTYDAAGRLATVADHTASGHGADLDASPCIVRAYAFDNNGRRKTLTSTAHADGDCAGTTGVTTTSASFDNYDTADRPTLGQGGTGLYVYDALGRQTTVPAVDAPDPTGGNITLGYFDDDLPRSVAQGGTSTVFTLDSAGRRSTATTTTGSTTSTLVRHYADGSDNPAWTDKDGAITRYAESIGGDLGLTLAVDGSGDLTLANLHGDVVTTVPVGATAASGDAALGVDGWSDFTEYGAPRAGSTTATTGGSVGYGWLGAKQRSTTSETAGLTLMGDRLYNAATGRFTSLDPEPGGNDTSYSYPNDPINMFDLDGHWGWRKIGRWAMKHKWDIALTATMFIPGVGAAAWAVRGGVWAARGIRAYRAARAVQGAGRMSGIASRTASFFRNGNNVLRMGRVNGRPWRMSIGPQRRHWMKMGRVRRNVSRLHVHMERGKGGIEWHTRRMTHSRRMWGNWQP